ncbi:MAG: preprotein translocase subunit SecE [Acidimicrobiales bacterium]
MAMNREQRRYLQKQGQLDAEGNAVAAPRENRQPTRSERVGPGQYVREVRSELRRVNWPTRAEVIKYTTVVVITVMLLTGFIAAADYLFGEGIIRLLRLGS